MKLPRCEFVVLSGRIRHRKIGDSILCGDGSIVENDYRNYTICKECEQILENLRMLHIKNDNGVTFCMTVPDRLAHLATIVKPETTLKDHKLMCGDGCSVRKRCWDCTSGYMFFNSRARQAREKQLRDAARIARKEAKLRKASDMLKRYNELSREEIIELIRIAGVK